MVWLIVASADPLPDILTKGESIGYVTSRCGSQRHPIVTTEHDRKSPSAIIRERARHWNLNHQLSFQIADRAAVAASAKLRRDRATHKRIGTQGCHDVVCGRSRCRSSALVRSPSPWAFTATTIREQGQTACGPVLFERRKSIPRRQSGQVIGASELSATCTPAARRSPAAKASCCQRSAPIGDRDARPPADVGEFAVGQRAGAAGSTDRGHQLASVGIASQHHACIVANVGFHRYAPFR
jgi:hypothetical protein